MENFVIRSEFKQHGTLNIELNISLNPEILPVICNVPLFHLFIMNKSISFSGLCLFVSCFFFQLSLTRYKSAPEQIILKWY